MCCPFRQMFTAFWEFRRSIADVKSNLADIKTILDGTLNITQEFEEVTGEFRNVVEFYANETKCTLRSHFLSSCFTDAGQTEIRHREFIKLVKIKLEEDINSLVDLHASRPARVAILNITRHLAEFVRDLRLESVSEIEQESKTKIAQTTDISQDNCAAQSSDNPKDSSLCSRTADKVSKSLKKELHCESQKLHSPSTNVNDAQNNLNQSRNSMNDKNSDNETNGSELNSPNSSDQATITTENNDDQARPTKTENDLKLMLLREMEHHFVESFEMYRRDEFLREDLTNYHAFIKVFCDKERIVSEFEHLITSHLDEEHGLPEDIVPPTERARELRYRERETRIRKLRQYLKDKIRVRRIGNIQQEEISLQLGVDLKKGVKKVGECQQVVSGYCEGVTNVLRNLPKQRFSEVLKEERLIDIRTILKQLINNNKTKGLNSPDQKVVVSSAKDDDVCSRDVDQTCERIMDDSGDLGSALLKPRNTIMMRWDENRHFENMMSALKKVVENTDVFKALSAVQLTGGNAVVDRRNYEQACSVLNNTILVDPQLFLNDLETVARPVIDVLIEATVKHALQLVDRSHVMARRVIDAANFSDVMHDVIDNKEIVTSNVFLARFFELLDCELDESEAHLIKSMAYACTNSKNNRRYFVKKLQQKLPFLPSLCDGNN